VALDEFQEEDLARSVESKVRMQMRKDAAAAASGSAAGPGAPFALLVSGTGVALACGDSDGKAVGKAVGQAAGASVAGKGAAAAALKWRLDASGRLEHQASGQVLAVVKTTSLHGRKRVTELSLQLTARAAADDDAQEWALNPETGALASKAAAGQVLTAKGEGAEMCLSKPLKGSPGDQAWAFRA
jgi:hypothetical protein